MRNIVCIVLSLVLVLCVFAGCDSSENNASSQNLLETFGAQSAEETTATPQTSQAAAGTTTAAPSPEVTMPTLDGEDTEDTAKPRTSGQITEHDSNDAHTSTAPSSTAAQTSSKPKTSSTPSTSTVPTAAPTATTTPATPSDEPDTSTMDGTYKSTLNKIRDAGTLPDGSSASASSVQYAEADVDGDGAAELVIRVSGSKELVCKYNGAGGVTVAGTMSPGTTYYSGGAATAGGNTAYTLYNYDSASGSYSQTATVEQWTRSDAEAQGEEESFNAFDLDGDGIVYIINGGEGPEYMDNSQYESWRSAVLGSAVSVGFQSLS